MIFSGGSYELFIPWSGMSRDQTSAMASNGKGKVQKSTAERVIKRHGKVFRGAFRLNDVELVITVYAQPAPRTTDFNKGDNLMAAYINNIVINCISYVCI